MKAVIFKAIEIGLEKTAAKKSENMKTTKKEIKPNRDCNITPFKKTDFCLFSATYLVIASPKPIKVIIPTFIMLKHKISKP
jgi:hypothetical protein